jgi:hypothetical protein
MTKAALRMIGLLLALVSQGCFLLISSGTVQICTTPGSGGRHFEVAVWCDSYPGLGGAIDTEIRIERGTGASLAADACQHALGVIVSQRRDHEPAPPPTTIALPPVWAICEWTGGDDLATERLDAPFTTFRPSERSASPLGLPRPPPSTHTI